MDNDEKSKLVYGLKYPEINREAALLYVKEYLREKIGEEIIISNTRELELGFFDYKNDKYNFIFTEYDERIQLVSTNGYTYFPEKNLTMYLWNVDEVQLTLEKLINDVLM